MTLSSSIHISTNKVDNQGVSFTWDFPVAQMVKNLPAIPGEPGLIPGSGRCPGEEHGNPLQYPCLENPTDRGTWMFMN